MITDSLWAWVSESNKLYIAATLLVVGAVTWLSSSPNPDPREPPVLKPIIPFIGHLLGLIMHEAEYLQKLSAKTTYPIFTLRIFSARIYVIKSPPLVQGIYRNPRSFSFNPIFVDASKNIFAMTDAHMAIITKRDPDSDLLDGYPLSKSLQALMHATMSSGPSLLSMNARALNRFSHSLDPISETKPQKVNLYPWLFEHFTLATSEALYGPNNPIALDPTLIDSLQDFASAIGLLYINVLPSITASKGYKARIAYAAAFKKYYDADHVSEAAAIIQGRKRILTGGGYTTDDISWFDIGIMLAATMNSTPALFWLILHIFSSPSLLSSIRSEIENITTLQTSKNGERKAELNISALNTSCPLLVSTWQETLRLTDATVSSRVVMEDAMLNNEYLLKKDGVIQMACGPMHTSSAIWGPDSAAFSASRFLPPSPATPITPATKKLRKQGFVPFGGGTVMCPGRYFASTEIMGVVANLVCGYEVTGLEGGELRVPGMKKQAMSVQVKQPDGDSEVLIKRREGWKGVKWGFVVGEGAEEVELFLD